MNNWLIEKEEEIERERTFNKKKTKQQEYSGVNER